MRQQETRLTSLPSQQAQPAAPRRVQSQVAQGQADNLPSYIPQLQDPEVEGFLKGLSQFQPSLDGLLKDERQKASERATLDAAAGKTPQESSAAYHDTFFNTDGLVKGMADQEVLKAKYNTEFDKDKGDLEKFLQENHQGRLKNVDDENYLSGYTKGILPAIMDIRKAHAEYQRTAIETKAESNLMQLSINGVRNYINTPRQKDAEGVEVAPEADYIHNLQADLSKRLKVSDSRFQELLFESVRVVGDEGHFDAYDILKKPRPDGSPGLYFDPKWRAKIDAAELHSFTASASRAEAENKRKYNTNLYDVFAEDDPKVAQAKFKEMKQKGLFKGDTEGLIKWEKLLLEKVDGKPDISQLGHEGDLLTKIYKGGLTYDAILKEESSGNITSGQRKYLLGEIRKVSTENRTIAAQEGKASEQIYRSKDFGSAQDYLEGILKPRPRDPYTTLGQGDLEFDNMQLAQARREFFSAVQGKKPGELQDVADAVAQRYLRRRQEAAKGGMSPEQKSSAVRGQIPFKTLPELIDAGRKGQLSPEEYARYSTYLKENHAR